MLQAQVPVPDVRRGEVAVDRHDGARTVEAVDRTAAIERRSGSVPWNGIEEILHGHISRRDGSTGGGSAGIDGSAGGDAARPEGVIECDIGLPVDGFVDEAAAAAQNGAALAIHVPCETSPRAEVLMVRVIEAADLMSDLHQARIGIEVSQKIV